MNELDGFYAAYITGMAGSGFVVLIFSKSRIVGVDTVGVSFDGTFEKSGNGYRANITVTVPPSTELIQGTAVGPDGMIYEVEMDLPQNFDQVSFIPIVTPLGKVNARFQRLRALGALG